jgi:hypothetical protein
MDRDRFASTIVANEQGTLIGGINDVGGYEEEKIS